MKKFVTETNNGKVEKGFRSGEVYIEHAFRTSNKDFTMRINLDKAETKKLKKLIETMED